MNRAEIAKYLTNPELRANASSEELRHLVEIYPYCEALHWIYLRSLYITDDAIFEDELMKYGMHISNRHLFYNYITTNYSLNKEESSKTEKGCNISSHTETQYIASLQTADYFALQQNPAQKQTLQQLAAQLKAARLAKNNAQSNRPLSPPDSPPNLGEDSAVTQDNNESLNSQLSTPTPQLNSDLSEENAKKLIREQKYSEAIEILRAISLNNPKKSGNFALQIKFLETIINNNNKK